MAVDINKALALISLRLIPAGAEVEPPTPFGRGTPVKRFREGLITAAQLHTELQTLGYLGIGISRSFYLAVLDRDFDLFEDKLTALQEAYDKDIITFEEMKHQVLTLIPDTEKALVLVDLWDFRKRPKPKALTPEEPPTLTVGRLLSAYSAGVLSEELLRAELAERAYSPVDIDVLVATETARLPKPKVEKQKELTLADLRSMFDLGVITADEFGAELLRRNYTPDAAARIIVLQEARQVAHAPKPKPEEIAQLSLGDLRSMLTLGVISPEEFQAELIARKYSKEDIARIIILEQARQAARIPKPKPEELKVLALGDLLRMFPLNIITEQDVRAELAERKLSLLDIQREIDLTLRPLPLNDLRVMFGLGTLTEQQFRAELAARGLSPGDIQTEIDLIVTEMPLR